MDLRRDRHPGVVPRRLRGLPEAAVLGRLYPVATRPLTRLLGLALLGPERAGPGLLIPRCRSVHTLGMRFALDLIFLDGKGQVVAVRRAVPPWRLAVERAARAVLELPARSTPGRGGERGTRR